MTAQIVDRVLRSRRYRDVDRGLLDRLAVEELDRSRNADEAVKRVKRRLHQAVGAFRGSFRDDGFGSLRTAWHGDSGDPIFRAECHAVMATHASTRERLPHLASLYPAIWAKTGSVPRSVLDIGCGLNPLALPWMTLAADATYIASDVDGRPLAAVTAFLELIGQPHRVEARDAVTDPPTDTADVALLLKLVTTLDRQDPGAASRLIEALPVRHAVVSFPMRSLAGRGKGMARAYRDRLDRLVAESGRVSGVAEASVPNELLFVLTLRG